MKQPQRPQELPYDLVNNFRHFDFKRSLLWIQYFGKLLYGSNFEIFPQDKETLYKLLIYTIRDEENCKKYNLDLNKGLMLTGPIGCGKTSLINIMRKFAYIETMYNIVSTRDIAAAYIQEGFPIIHKYGKTSKIYCFDDLGIERSMKHFGNDCNTMAEILLSRYDFMTQLGTITHATTNLNAKELEDAYGNRVRSRLRSMFNLVSFAESSFDKRK